MSEPGRPWACKYIHGDRTEMLKSYLLSCLTSTTEFDHDLFCFVAVVGRQGVNRRYYRWAKPPLLYGKFPLLHYGQKQPRIQTEVLGHSLVRSLVRSHRSSTSWDSE